MEFSTREKKPHVVVLPFPAQSHITPLLHLSSELASHGFRITVVNIDSVHRRLLEQWSYKPGLDIHLADVPCHGNFSSGICSEHLRQEKERPGSVLAILASRKPHVRELIQSLEPVPCCMISDIFLVWTPGVAQELNILHVAYWPGSAAWSALHLFEDLLASHGDAFQDEESENNRLISYVPGASALEYSDIPGDIRLKRPEPKDEYFREMRENLSRSECTLVNSMVELEPQTFQTLQNEVFNGNYLPVGPLFTFSNPQTPSARGSLREEDNSCLEWLDSHQECSVLYISFGSISSMSETMFYELTAGIEASKVPFLWVIRSDLVEGCTEEKFEAFRERTQDQGLVASWVPQLRVLAHSSVGGFLSHCGWNSTLESICNGVPLLCWPFFSDQRLNSKMVAKDWLFGKIFAKQQDVDRVEVEEKIRDFMHGPDVKDIRMRVHSFKERAHQTTEDGGASNSSLRTFMRTICLRSTQAKVV